MSNLKRQSSWQEDLARNFSRLFTRSKTQDPDKTEIKSDTSQDNEVSIPPSETSKEDSLQVPNTEFSQSFEDSEEYRVGDGDKDSERGEDAALGDAGGSPSEQQLPPSPSPPGSPAATGSGSPAPPVDGFFKRLGSLFHFGSRTEARESQQEVETRGMTWGTEESQTRSDASSPTTGEEWEDAEPQFPATGSQTGEGELGQRAQPVEPSHPATNPKQTATQSAAQAEPWIRNNLASEEVTDEERHVGDEGETADNPPVKEDLDEQRRHALACPPVVTYGTYRGLREIRRMRRRPQVQVHSPISEGEEVQQGRGSLSSEEVVSPQLATPSVIPTAEHRAETTSSSEMMISDQKTTLEHATAAPSAENCTQPCNSHIPLLAHQMGTAVTQSAFLKDNEAGVQTLTSNPSPRLTTDSCYAAEKDCGRCDLIADKDKETETCGREQDSSTTAIHKTAGNINREVAESSSVQQKPTGSPSLIADAHLCQATDTHGTESPHPPASASRGFQDIQQAPFCMSLPSLRNPEQSKNPTSPDMEVDLTSDSLKDNEEERLLTGEYADVNEETLRLESKKMVDDILQSALVALQRIGDSEQEGEMLSVSGFLFTGQDGHDVSTKPEHLFKQGSAEQDDTITQSTLIEESLATNRTHAEPSRSTPSSGYESIAGSDTDIRSSQGWSYEGTAATISVSCQQEGQDQERRLVIGCPTENKELHVAESAVCQERGSINSINLAANNDSSTARAETSSELSPQKQGLHSDSNTIYCTNSTSVQPTISETVSVQSNEKKVQVHYILEDYGVNVAVFNQEKGESDKPLHVAKDTAESNNHSNKPDSSSFNETTIINNINKSSHLNSIDNNVCQSEAGSLESEPLSSTHISETLDPNEKVVRPKPSQIAQQLQFRLENWGGESDTPYSTRNEGVKRAPESASVENRQSQGSVAKVSSGDEGFVLVESYLASVVEDRSDSEGEDLEPAASRPVLMNASNKGPLPSKSSEGSALGAVEDTTQQTVVKAYRCDVAEDANDDSDGRRPDVLTGLSFDGGGRTSSLHVPGKRVHLDVIGSSSRAQASGLHPLRLHELDLHHSEGGFAIIDEEEETDTVFVNDTGPMLSPTVRRGKAYPFSLSPIFEEECVRDEASAEEGLQVPPATEEELKSVEQQASSILSLLQSVSERLQSSAFSEYDQDTADDDPPVSFHRPLWDRFSDRDEGEDDDEESQVTSMDQKPTRLVEPLEGQSVEDEYGFHSSTDKSPDTFQNEEQETKQCSNIVPHAGRTADTPFYHYLKSRVVPALETNSFQETEQTLYHGEKQPVTTSVTEERESCGKVISRPTVMHIYEGVTFSGEKCEICEDLEDATGMVYPQGASVRVLSGCWLLYLEPGYRGSCVVLEEGESVLSDAGNSSAPTSVSIRSIRRVVKNDGIPEIHLQTSGTQEAKPLYLNSETDCLDRYGPVSLSSLSVKSGCWLAYDSAGFTGNCTVLEAGGSSTPILHKSPVSCVRSLRPLRMGGLKVRRALDPKMVVYGEPHFRGLSRELLGNTDRLDDPEGLRVSSLRVIGGVWVGYSKDGYRGQQYLLEEGEYSNCQELGGTGHALCSFRFILADFIEPSVSLRAVGSAEPEEVNIVDRDVPDLRREELSRGTASVCVKSGVWVAYSGRFFSGDQYVLEKGQHSGTLDWGSCQSPPMSIRPVRLEICGDKEPKFLLHAYSGPDFAGESREYSVEIANCGSCSPVSLRVIRGSWLLYDGVGCSGNQFVVGEGLYPDLISCSAVATRIKSLKPIPYSFSDPSISLFSLDAFEGLETVAKTSVDNMNNLFPQSLRVNSGLWVVYEYSKFKGRQMLLQTGEYPYWIQHSGWDTVGSLRPLRQPKVYFRVRSRALGSVLTVEKVQDESSPANLFLSPACSQDTQLWLFTDGLLKCKEGKTCLSVIGGKPTVGARVALWREHGRTHQRWSLNENGTISSHLNHNLVLDLRGGSGSDKGHLVISEVSADKATQQWDMEVV